jgi:1,2-diacylglycerol 3-beta-glucosyltransferase
VSSALLLGLLNAAAFMLCVSFVAYATLIIVPYIRHQPGVAGDNRDFKWHFLIPCLDEEAVIGQTVEHLVHTFPQADVWLVDDDSSDATPLILSGLARHHEQVHVVTRTFPEARIGKGPALNAGWAAMVAAQAPDAEAARHIV